VHKLLVHDGYDDANHILFTDNWYTSLDVARLCLLREIHVVGTIKTNRSGIPKDGIFPAKGAGVKARGEMKSMYNATESTYFTAWMDNKPVHMLHTFPTESFTCDRKDKTDGEWRKLSVNRPTIIGLYNKGMGGTDKLDQKTSYYSYEHSSVRWTHRIFSHFLMVAAANAHILYTWGKVGKLKMEFLEFLRLIIIALSGIPVNVNTDPDLPEDFGSKRCRSDTWLKADMMAKRLNKTEFFHYPSDVNTKFPDERRECVVCTHKTRTKCSCCNAFLCCDGSGMQNHFWRFHNIEDFKVY